MADRGSDSSEIDHARRELLAQLRRARGDRPQASLARALRRSRQWVSKVEAGAIDVSLSDFIALCDALGLTVQLLPDVDQLRRRIHELAGRGVHDDFGIRVLRAIAREIERDDHR